MAETAMPTVRRCTIGIFNPTVIGDNRRTGDEPASRVGAKYRRREPVSRNQSRNSGWVGSLLLVGAANLSLIHI